MNHEIIIKTLLFTLFFISLSSINATDLNLNPEDSINDAITNVNANGSTTNNNTITLNNGTYNKNTDRNNNITINNINLTIKGNGEVIIDAQHLGRIFNIIGNSNITFTTITFRNANTSSGGAIYNNLGKLNIVNCTFTNNMASNNGGAIYNDGGDNMSIVNSIFYNNAAQFGGAVHFNNINRSFTVYNSNFANNSANPSDGGALVVITNNCNISNSNFTNNSANDWGGALECRYGNFTINNCIFINNEANNFGGAIHNYRADSVTVTNSSFRNNTANDSGGAIHNTGGNFSVSNSDFTNNTATYGGAVYSSNNNSLVNYSNFTSNQAFAIGGGIFNNGNMSVFGNLMMNNSAALGQIIYNNGYLGILNLTFIDNSTKTVKNGNTVILYASLTDDMGNTITGQNISFYVNGVLIGTVESIEGLGNLMYTSNTLGILPINGSYYGHGTYSIVNKNGELNVTKLATNSTVNVPNIVKVKKTTTINGVLTDENGNFVANVQFIVIVDGQVYTLTTDNRGRWSLSYKPFHTGSIEVLVKFLGDDKYFGSQNSTSFKSVKQLKYIKVKVKGNRIIATLCDKNGKRVAGEKVYLTQKGKILGFGITNQNGQVIFDYSGPKIDLKVVFGGSDRYYPVSVVVKVNDDDNNKSKNIPQSSNPKATDKSKNTLESNNPKITMENTGIPFLIVMLVLLTFVGLLEWRKK
ncbi:chlamydia polymorphic membrane protein [Methanobrevibacter cuticularis]|uniref:Chlamydia polymorphic membrane protein n=2 Tax=Methanobrevibacter cuticularis TaxID=47311 RepID=A0A166CNI9_9EURY|nr:chlamydia polymorphic membrane protein [Methanobrevibacter cuticularis]